MSKVYVSGPMTGLPECNFPEFHKHTANLRKLGYFVVNPAEINPDHGQTWDYYMRRDITAMMDCDTIFMLTNWTKSRGARLEHQIAVELGFTIMGALQ